MKYGTQLQNALENLDNALAKLHTLIKRGENQAAIHYMEQGQLKDRYDELQNIITISQVGTLGARGTNQTGTF